MKPVATVARAAMETRAAVVVGAAAYVGLVLGGYLSVPPALEGLAEWWWTAW